MKKDIELLKYKLEGLQEINMRMLELCEPNSEEQHHLNGSLVAIDKVLEIVSDLDEEPYSIQKLIHDYEYKTGTFDWATALRGALHGESEETEVKKDREYLRSVIQRRIDNLPSTYEGLYIEGSRDAYELVLRDINELDEPEVLSQEWIDKNKTSIDRKLDGTPIYKVREELLQNLLVPKQESEVLSQESEVLSQEWIRNNQERKGVHFFVNVTKLQNLIVPKEELTMTKLETLTVPTDLGEWLQSRRIGDSGVYFSMIDTLYHYWENVLSSSTDSFIKDNKKELIEVILGSREYEVEEPLYHALIKGHELADGYDIYWNYDKYDEGVFVSRLYPLHDNFITEMSKSQWNELGINDSNADFIRVDGVEE